MNLIISELKAQLQNVKGTVILFIMPFIIIVLVGSLLVSMDPKKLPTAILMNDHSAIARSFIARINQSKDHRISHYVESEAEGQRLLQQGKVAYLITIPTDFSRDLIRGAQPEIGIEMDATVTTKGLTINGVLKPLMMQELTGSLSYLNKLNPPFSLVVHERYNPEALSQYRILPGFIGVTFLVVGILLNQILMIIKANSAPPIVPHQHAFALIQTISCILPFLIVQWIQSSFVLLIFNYIFYIPIYGNSIIFVLGLALYSCCNVLLAYTFSVGAKSIITALATFAFVFIPSFIMSGFLFPYYGMPRWAQIIGDFLPMRHFVQISRGVIIKATQFNEIWIHIWPLILMAISLLVIATLRTYRYNRAQIIAD